MIKFKRLLQFLWHYWKHLLKFCLCISVIFNVAFLWYTKVTLLLHSILIVCMASLINGERTPFGIFIFKFLEYVIPGCYLKENVIEKKKLMLKDSKNWRKRFHMVLKYFNNKVTVKWAFLGHFFPCGIILEKLLLLMLSIILSSEWLSVILW